MSIEDAKKILAGDVAAISPEILQKAAKIILSELGKAEEKIFELEQKLFLEVTDFCGEIWRDVVDYEGLYKVSNMGRIKSLYGKKEKFLKVCVSGFGYAFVGLTKDKIHKTTFVHCLVAKAFLSNPHEYPVVNHIDGNKTNNRAENLEWVTHSENLLHAYSLGLRKPKPPQRSWNAKLSDDDVRYIRKNYKSHDKKFGAIPLAKKFNVEKSVIHGVVSFKTYKDVK